MTARATPRQRWIRSLTGAIAMVGLAGAATAQPLPRPDTAKLPENPVVERPVVGVIDLRADTESQKMARALAEVIGKLPELQAVTDQRVAAALVGPLDDEDTRSMATARDRLDQAREQMANFQLGVAINSAQEGRKALLSVTPTPSVINLLADLVFTEGQAQFANQHKPDARTAFTLVHQLVPGRTLDPDSYLPELVDAFAGAAAPPAGTATLEVKASGTVWLDGHPQGDGNQTLTVSPGLHVLIESGRDLLPSGTAVEVGAGQTKPVALEHREALEPVRAARARRALIAAPDPTARAGAIEQVRRLTRMTDAVIITADAKGNPAVQLWRNRAPGFGEIRPVAHSLDQAEAERIIAPLVPKKIEPVTDVPLPPPPPPTKWYRKRWVQVTGVAVGVLAVIASSIAISNAVGAESRPLGPGGINERPTIGPQ